MDSLPVIEKIAPVIFSALGYPIAGAVAVNILSEVFGIDKSVAHTLDKGICEGDKCQLETAEDKFIKWATDNMPNEVDANFKFKWS